MMDIENFSVIEKEFHARIHKIIWCTFTTVDLQNRPRSRMLHPIWEGRDGWVATGRHSHKAKHIAHNPYVSLTYWDPDHQQIYAECKATWVEDQAIKNRIWDLYEATPPPLGYDLSMFWAAGPEDPGFGLLQLVPWRIELSSLANMGNPQVWRRDE